MITIKGFRYQPKFSIKKKIYKLASYHSTTQLQVHTRRDEKKKVVLLFSSFGTSKLNKKKDTWGQPETVQRSLKKGDHCGPPSKPSVFIIISFLVSKHIGVMRTV